MKDTSLHTLIQFTLSRYDGTVNCPVSPKLIAFFQTMCAYSPMLYQFFSKNLGEFNKYTLQQMTVNQSSEVPIIDFSFEAIKERAKSWIEKIRNVDIPDDTIIVSAIADATKVPPIGETSHTFTSL